MIVIFIMMTIKKFSIANYFQNKLYIFYFIVIITIILASVVHATQIQINPQKEDKIYEVLKSKKYKSNFQKLKDQITSQTLKAYISGTTIGISDSLSCDSKTMKQIIKKKSITLTELEDASCKCCIVKELSRKEDYPNSVGKCKNISPNRCSSQFQTDENTFFNQTKLLYLNPKKNIRTSEKNNDYLRYIWDDKSFYLQNDFTQSTYTPKFLVNKGYIIPEQQIILTSITPYNHHYKKATLTFFNPWPNAAPPDPVVNAASGLLGSLNIKKAQRPWIPQVSYKTIPVASVEDGIRATMIGHATILLQFDGINILTDPIYFNIGVGNKEKKMIDVYERIKAPGVPFDKLPKIHYVVLSHNHMDHLDIRTLKNIEKRFPKVIYITPLGYTDLLKENKINHKGNNRIFELDWWDNINFPGIRFTALPTQHWCGRTADDVNKMLWSAYAIKTTPNKEENSKLIYFAGDTGFGPHFDAIAKEYDHFDLSLIPIGAYCPMHKEGGGHINPYEAVKVHKILKSKQSMGIHFDTFQVAQEPYGEAKKILEASLKHYHINLDEFVAPNAAEYVHISNSGGFTFHKNSESDQVNALSETE